MFDYICFFTSIIVNIYTLFFLISKFYAFKSLIIKLKIYFIKKWKQERKPQTNYSLR